MIVDRAETRRGSAVRDGQRLVWQAFGQGEDVVLLLPTWSIVHSDFWRHQVAALAEGRRVIAYDGLGNGASDRPLDPARYDDHAFADDAVAVLDACGVDRAVVLGSSQGGAWALSMAGRYPERVEAAVFIAPNVPLAPGHPDRARGAATFDDRLDEHAGWARWNRHYWLEHYPDFLRFFFGSCFTEPDSVEEIGHFFAMGMQTTPEVLLASGGTGENGLTAESAEAYARDLPMPTLVLHGDSDAITPLARGQELAVLTGAELHVLTGSGHEPHVRSPEVVNPILESFLSRLPRSSR